eukprot:c19711_g1_i1.p1 GENE.c19711_g1_i1~~c19711_g1_i1.p1  ORF type:complete len:411 (+),score=101.62 c19711_g1_i1:1427-2659(+)
MYAFADNHPEGTMYLVLEYCQGGELFTNCRKRDKLSETDARHYAAEILVGLEYLHSCGVVYRDLKSSNVLLGADGHVRLTDFDLSVQTTPSLTGIQTPTTSDNPDTARIRHKSVVKGNSGIKLPGRVLGLAKGLPQVLGHNSYNTRIAVGLTEMVGTLEYVAPEVMTKKSYDDVADWWSFGILVLELVTGATPWGKMARADIARAIKKGQVNIPENKMTPLCFDLLKKLLNPNPAKRLGARNGAADIKAHPFFAGLDFNKLRHMTPPIVPQVTAAFDTAYFTGMVEEQENEVDDPDNPLRQQLLRSELGDEFHGFYFARPIGDKYTISKRPRVQRASLIEQAMHVNIEGDGSDPNPTQYRRQTNKNRNKTESDNRMDQEANDPVRLETLDQKLLEVVSMVVESRPTKSKG